MSSPSQENPSESQSKQVRAAIESIRPELDKTIAAALEQAVRNLQAQGKPQPHVATEIASALGTLTEKMGQAVQTMVVGSTLQIWERLSKESGGKLSINSEELLRTITQASSEAAQEAFRALGRSAEAVVQLSVTWAGDQDPSGRRGTRGTQN